MTCLAVDRVSVADMSVSVRVVAVVAEAVAVAMVWLCRIEVK